MDICPQATVRDGFHFWESLRPFCDNYADGSRGLWHHGEEGVTARLAWHWDRELYWLALHSSMAMLHHYHTRQLEFAEEFLTELGPEPPAPHADGVETRTPQVSEFRGVRPDEMREEQPSAIRGATATEAPGAEQPSAVRGATAAEAPGEGQPSAARGATGPEVPETQAEGGW